MGGHPVGEPDQAGLRPGGMVPPWPAMPPGNQQPMPPCSRCGAAFGAHLDGRCPQTGVGAENVTAPQWEGSQGTTPPYAHWAPPLGGPPPVPQLAGPKPPWRNWPRRHPLLTGAIMLIVLLVSIGIVHEVSQAVGQTANGNATACSDYWNMTNAADSYDLGAEAAGWRDLQAAAPGITSPALSAAVQAFDEDLNSDDTVDAETASIAVGTACTTLGYGDPG